MNTWERPEVIHALDMLALDVNEWAEGKGFNKPLVTVKEAEAAQLKLLSKSSMIALMHSELSELLEGLRKPKHIPDVNALTNEEEELADLIIRALHYAGKYELRIGEAIYRKMQINQGRPYLHGKKF